ncbi:MAG TPA: zinc ribbon domain-containing protein [Planctomycetota bacterium]|nr:zinc ribbon domain-containing protein [Planctomycetota bacterium]
MRKCPFCLAEIPLDAKVCTACQSTVVKKCSACNAEILATAKRCRYCAADLEGAPPPVSRLADAPCGERRDILLTLLLVFLTCGFWSLIVQYKMGCEINRHLGRERLNPGMDLALVFLTCGLWMFFIMVKYPQAMQEMIAGEGERVSDLVLPSILLTFLGLHLVALLILQDELNKHWTLHALPRS